MNNGRMNLVTFVKWILKNHTNVVLEFMEEHNMSFGEEE